MDVGWAFTVARGWGRGPFIDEPASSGDPQRATTPPQGEDKPSPLLWTSLTSRFVGMVGATLVVARRGRPPWSPAVVARRGRPVSVARRGSQIRLSSPDLPFEHIPVWL